MLKKLGKINILGRDQFQRISFSKISPWPRPGKFSLFYILPISYKYFTNIWLGPGKFSLFDILQKYIWFKCIFQMKAEPI